MSKKRILVISGPSGVGKTTLCDHLIRKEHTVKPCVTATSRSPRPGEKHGKDYFFLTKKEFKDGIKRGKFVEFTTLFGNYYGTPVESLRAVFDEGKYPLLKIDVKGARNLKNKGYKGVYIFILPPDEETLKHRLIQRKSKESKEEIKKRLSRAKREMTYRKDYDFEVVNDKIPRAVRQIQDITREHLC
ncbi:MAG: guanylate kinase [Planctomycetota bacterium]|nr:guanylate kinase [Planctomycetota bacterium]MDI6788232.1 guanylate kinase [Planctomycetota bacterium]